MREKISAPTNQKASLKTAIPGPKSQALRAREDKHIAPGLQRFALMAGMVVDHASGSTVTGHRWQYFSRHYRWHRGERSWATATQKSCERFKTRSRALRSAVLLPPRASSFSNASPSTALPTKCIACSFTRGGRSRRKRIAPG